MKAFLISIIVLLLVFFIGCVEEKECVDLDGDGFGIANLENCVQKQLDCDDSNANIFPNATELCDGIDNDCDEMIDEDCIQSGDELDFVKNYPLEEGWIKSIKQGPFEANGVITDYIELHKNRLWDITFSNDEIICKYGTMYGGGEEKAEFTFSFYELGTEPPVGSFGRGLGPIHTFYSKKYAIYVFSPCSGWFGEFPFIEELIQKLEEKY